jgi:hypothetical protein
MSLVEKRQFAGRERCRRPELLGFPIGKTEAEKLIIHNYDPCLAGTSLGELTDPIISLAETMAFNPLVFF